MQRPTTVTVFGILHLVFGVLGICGIAYNVFALIVIFSVNGAFVSPLLQHPLGRLQTVVGTVLSVPITFVLIAAGIGLLLMKSWARVLSVIYGAFSIVSKTVNLAVFGYVAYQTLGANPQAQSPELIGGAIGGFCGGMFVLIYPALVLYFMTRPWIVAAFDAHHAANDWSSNEASLAAEAMSLTAPSDNPFSAPQVATSAAPVAPPPASGETLIDTLVPARNGPALGSYYLGLFSLFPLLGLPLAIAALVLGVKGLRRARKNPEVRGRVHAWVGIVCGSIFGLFNLLLTGFTVVGVVALLLEQAP